MKKIVYLLSLPIILFLTSCGSTTTEEDHEISTPQGMIEIDLSSYGISAIIAVPDTITSPLEINTSSSGEIEVLSGNTFQLMIAEGGDLELKKSDISSDLLYKATVISETPNSLIYKMELPDGSMTFHHFYSVIEINGTSYEVNDVATGESFSQKAVENMLESAKNIKAKIAS